MATWANSGHFFSRNQWDHLIIDLSDECASEEEYIMELGHRLPFQAVYFKGIFNQSLLSFVAWCGSVWEAVQINMNCITSNLHQNSVMIVYFFTLMDLFTY